ncbi:hypothetical protein [Streptacidiphilus sp. PAMC 29251]
MLAFVSAFVLVLTLCASTASAAVYWRRFDDSVVGTKDGRLLVLEFGGASTFYSGRAYTSSDAGASWQDSPTVAVGVLSPTEVPGLVVRTEACVPAEPERCYRVVPGRLPRVEQSDDGGRNWSTAWQLSAGRVLFLRRNGEPGSDEPGSSLRYGSTSLAVMPVPGGHGYTVVVADQNDGLVLRDPAGHWARRGMASAGPYETALPDTGLGDAMSKEYLLALGAAWLTLLVGTGAAQLRRDRRGAVLLAHGLRVALGFGWLAVIAAQGGIDGEPSTYRMVLLTLAGPVVLFGLWLNRGPRVFRPALRRTLAAAFLVTWPLTLLPFLGWSVARPDGYPLAVLLFLLLLLGSLLATGALAWWLSDPRSRGADDVPCRVPGP